MTINKSIISIILIFYLSFKHKLDLIMYSTVN